MVKNERIASMSLDGETLCLNFINTVHNRRDEPLPDYLFNAADLVAWAEKAGLADEKVEKRLEKVILDNPGKARKFFTEAISLRELLYRMFFAVTVHKNISPADLAGFNIFLKDNFSHLKVIRADPGYKQSWNFPSDGFHQLTAPIVKDAYDLLLSDRLHKVKECPNCGWLFLDTTKNGKRRWCSMKNCGSNIKALDWYYRQKGNGAV